MKALWEARYPIPVLEQRKREIGVLEFDREMQCTPRSSESSIFPYELFEPLFCDEVMVSGHDGSMAVSQGWDFSMPSVDTKTSDYTVGFTLGLDSEGKRHILDIQRFKGRSFREQVGAIDQHYALYSARKVIVETVLFQQIYEEFIREISPGVPIEGHATGRNKADLAVGVPSLRLHLERKDYRIPRGDQRSRDLTDLWIAEAMAFGWHNDKLEGVGEHDDIVMAWWFAEIGLRILKGDAPRAGAVVVAGASRPKAETPVDGLQNALGTSAPPAAAVAGAGLLAPAKPKTPMTRGGLTSQPADEDGLLVAMKGQGYVPSGCYMDGGLVLALMNSGEDPCKGCRGNRGQCGGRTLD